jgi:hypothetical protein
VKSNARLMKTIKTSRWNDVKLLLRSWKPDRDRPLSDPR